MRRGGNDAMCKDKKWWPDYKCGGGGRISKGRSRRSRKSRRSPEEPLEGKKQHGAHSVNCFVWRTTTAMLGTDRVVLVMRCFVCLILNNE
jgi:hypothetical protein